MKRLRQTAIISTTVSVLALFLLANTVLAKPPWGRPCVVLFEVPFTERSFELPLWMWGLVPFSVLGLSTLAALTSWVVLLFKWRAKVGNANVK
jgi:hypothetical protein